MDRDAAYYINFLQDQLTFYFANADYNYAPIWNWYGITLHKELDNAVQTALMMGDEKSAELYEQVLAARLGMLFISQQRYFSLRPFYTPEQIKKFIKLSSKHAINVDGIHDRMLVWGMENYSYHGEMRCEAELGDIVIDAGAFTGGTALYFSSKTGETGHVYSFEATPATYKVLVDNLKEVSNITAVPMALWDKEEQLKFPETIGPGNRAMNSGGIEVAAISLDLWAERNNISKIDFIKMDIEGAEIPAIEGAKGIISRCRPKMAISAYHKPDDLWRIARKVLSITPFYKLFLAHGSTTFTNTCLFFHPSETALTIPSVPDLTSLKDAYSAARELLLKRTYVSFLEKVIVFLQWKHGKTGINYDMVLTEWTWSIKVPFSVYPTDYYKLCVSGEGIDIELCFENVAVKKTAEQRVEIISYFGKFKDSYPNVKIKLDNSQLVLFFNLPFKENNGLARQNFFCYEDLSEAASDYLNLIIDGTISFLVKNGYVSGKYMYFWHNLAEKLVNSHN